MSDWIIACFEDQDVQEASRMMQERHVRRLLVLDRATRLVGIVSLGDLATEFGHGSRYPSETSQDATS